MSENQVIFTSTNPATRGSISVSHHTTRSCSRTTLCDILCTTPTQKEIIIREPRKLSKEAEARAGFTFQKPYTLGMYYAIDDPTPMQKLRRNEVKVKRNLDMKKERDEFFKRLNNEKVYKQRLEYDSATLIQACYRGYQCPLRKKPENFDRSNYQRYARVPASVQEINAELCSWQSSLQLKPIPGLTLESAGRNAKRQAKFEYAAAIRIQCFFRMISATLRVMIKRQKRDAMRKFDSSIIICKFFYQCLKKVRLHRKNDNHKHHAAVLIQSSFRIFSARSWVRRVYRMKKSAIRRNDAATRLQRTFMNKLKIRKGSGKSGGEIILEENGNGGGEPSGDSVVESEGSSSNLLDNYSSTFDQSTSTVLTTPAD